MVDSHSPAHSCVSYRRGIHPAELRTGWTAEGGLSLRESLQMLDLPRELYGPLRSLSN